MELTIRDIQVCINEACNWNSKNAGLLYQLLSVFKEEVMISISGLHFQITHAELAEYLSYQRLGLIVKSGLRLLGLFQLAFVTMKALTSLRKFQLYQFLFCRGLLCPTISGLQRTSEEALCPYPERI